MLHSPPEYDDATMAGNTGHGPPVGRLTRDGDGQVEDVSEPWLERACKVDPTHLIVQILAGLMPDANGLG